MSKPEMMPHIQRLMRAQTPAELRRFERKASAGILVRPMRGMFADANEWGKLSASERARRIVATLSDIHKSWVFSLFSAAALYGLEVGRDNIFPIYCQSQKRAWRSRNGLIVTLRSNDPEICLVDGIAVTPPAQTVVGCLCMADFGRALALADSAMRVLGMTKQVLWEELNRREDCEGWRVARDAIMYADPLSMNGGESVARAVMIEQGFMIPQLQVKRRDPLNAGAVYYVDYLWDMGEQGIVVGELDGKDKYVLPEMTGGKDVLEVLRDERLRESRISAGGVRVMRFSYRDVLDTERFCHLLELYGVPRGAARPIGR